MTTSRKNHPTAKADRAYLWAWHNAEANAAKAELHRAHMYTAITAAVWVSLVGFWTVVGITIWQVWR